MSFKRKSGTSVISDAIRARKEADAQATAMANSWTPFGTKLLNKPHGNAASLRPSTTAQIDSSPTKIPFVVDSRANSLQPTTAAASALSQQQQPPFPQAAPPVISMPPPHPQAAVAAAAAPHSADIIVQPGRFLARKVYVASPKAIAAEAAAKAYLPLVERYRPTALCQIAGHTQSIDQLQRWIRRHALRRKQTRAAAFIRGPYGVGKTCAAKLALKEAGYTIVEVGCAEVMESKGKSLRDLVALYATRASLCGPVGILVDAIDSISSYGADVRESGRDSGDMDKRDKLGKFSEWLRSADVDVTWPIIITCTNMSSKFVRDVQSQCDVIYFNPPSYDSMRRFIEPIMTREKMLLGQEAIANMLTGCAGDVRSLLCMLEWRNRSARTAGGQDLPAVKNSTMQLDLAPDIFKTTEYLLRSSRAGLNLNVAAYLAESDPAMYASMVAHNYIGVFGDAEEKKLSAEERARMPPEFLQWCTSAGADPAKVWSQNTAYNTATLKKICRVADDLSSSDMMGLGSQEATCLSAYTVHATKYADTPANEDSPLDNFGSGPIAFPSSILRHRSQLMARKKTRADIASKFSQLSGGGGMTACEFLDRMQLTNALSKSERDGHLAEAHISTSDWDMARWAAQATAPTAAVAAVPPEAAAAAPKKPRTYKRKQSEAPPPPPKRGRPPSKRGRPPSKGGGRKRRKLSDDEKDTTAAKATGQPSAPSPQLSLMSSEKLAARFKKTTPR